MSPALVKGGGLVHWHSPLDNEILFFENEIARKVPHSEIQPNEIKWKYILKLFEVTV